MHFRAGQSAQSHTADTQPSKVCRPFPTPFLLLAMLPDQQKPVQGMGPWEEELELWLQQGKAEESENLPKQARVVWLAEGRGIEQQGAELAGVVFKDGLGNRL